MELTPDNSNKKIKSDSEECVVDLASYQLLDEKRITNHRTKVCIQFKDLGCSFRCEKGKFFCGNFQA